MTNLSRTNKIYCSEAGMNLIYESSQNLLYIKQIQMLKGINGSIPIFQSIGKEEVPNVDPTLEKLSETLMKFPQFKSSLLMCLVRGALVKVHQKQGPIYSEKVLNFFQLIRSHSPKCADVVSANLFGPTNRWIQKINSKEDIPSILEDNKTTVLKRICDIVKKNQDITGKKTIVSLAVDATKVAPALQLDSTRRKIVGGIFPNHQLDISEMTSEDIQNTLKNCSTTKAIKIATEIKVAVITFQNRPPNPPFLVVKARPQGNNEQNNFLTSIISIVNEACIICKDVFTNFAVDGVSIESHHVRKSICDFLNMESTYIGTTDPNHNAKSIVYQIIGGSSLPFIGTKYIDASLLHLAEVPEDLWRPSDFSSDLIVLKLCSSITMEKLIQLRRPIYRIKSSDINILILTLYFIRLRLYSINASNVLASNRVKYMWSSTLWLISISGVSRITKRNLAAEMISFSFLMLRKDIYKPKAMTTESAEHKFGIYRSMIHEFTVLDFEKLHRRSVIRMNSLFNGNLNPSREPRKGYGSTFFNYCADMKNNNNDLFTGPVDATKNTSVHISEQLWCTLCPIVNNCSWNITKLLENFNMKSVDHLFLTKMFTRRNLLDAYLDICPSTFGSNETDSDRNNVTVDLEEQIDAFVRNINCDDTLQEEDAFLDNEMDSSNYLVDNVLDNQNKMWLTKNNDLMKLHQNIITCSHPFDSSRISEDLMNSMLLIESSYDSKGSTSFIQKHKSLNRRWMISLANPSMEAIVRSNNGYILERDVIIEIETNPHSTKKFYRILGVYTKFYNKWYLMTKKLQGQM